MAVVVAVSLFLALGIVCHLHSDVELEWQRIVGYFYDLKLNSKFDSLLLWSQSISFFECGFCPFGRSCCCCCCCSINTIAQRSSFFVHMHCTETHHTILYKFSPVRLCFRITTLLLLVLLFIYLFFVFFQQYSLVIRPFSVSLFFIIVIDYFGHGVYSFAFRFRCCCFNISFFLRMCVCVVLLLIRFYFLFL